MADDATAPGGTPAAAATDAVDARVAAEFADGIRRGRDPANDPGAALSHTTLDSAWWDEDCETCNHTFRIGDPVLVERDVERRTVAVRHNLNLPACVSRVTDDDQVDPAVQAAFFDAVAEHDVTEAVPGTAAVPRRYSETSSLVRARTRCLLCGTTVRPYEAVVVCPCSPVERTCRSVIHHDPAAGLSCYDDMYPKGQPLRCPVFFDRVTPPQEAGTQSRLSQLAAQHERRQQIIVVRGRGGSDAAPPAAGSG
jgi:hypothetical protein